MKTLDITRLKKAANKDDFMVVLEDILTEILMVMDNLQENFDKRISDLEQLQRTEKNEKDWW